VGSKGEAHNTTDTAYKRNPDQNRLGAPRGAGGTGGGLREMINVLG